MRIYLVTLFTTCAVLIGAPLIAYAATLSVEPAAGSFAVGSTFNVSIFLDTEDELVNAIQAHLKFPPDKLQVVSPSTGLSIINVWTANPTFNNREGTITFQGVVPSGIYASKGLISTITFRVKGVGQALVKFTDKSEVILADGRGTDTLRDTANALYNLILPPPSGPIVVSETHPNQSAWYPNNTPILSWATEGGISRYSYILSTDPTELPDNISEGEKTSVAYQNLESGTNYFTIKALRNGIWGGLTRFAINIDAESPAEFQIEITPSKITTSRNPTIRFGTTDAHSGINRYEYKIVHINPIPEDDTGFFIEAQLPEVLSLERGGKYDIIARAYDNAGNIREVIERIEVVTPFMKAVKSLWIWVVLIVLLPLLSIGAWRVRRWHGAVAIKRTKKKLPTWLQKKLKELKKYKEKYTKLAAVLLIVIGSFLLITPVSAQQLALNPPLITTASRNISNNEIFYIGGKSDVVDMQIVLYLQNLQTGETFNYSIISNQKYDWFYRHPGFLSTGKYLLWAQSKLGDEISPPTPQVQMTVSPTALQFGASRLSYETLYLILATVLLLISFGLALFIIFHTYHGRKKHKEFMKEVREAEEAVRKGFAILRQDIEAELAFISKVKMSKSLSIEEKMWETQLLKDLDEIQKHISKEILDIEEVEYPH